MRPPDLDGLILDVPVPDSSVQPLTDLLASLPPGKLLAAALLVLFFVVSFDTLHPQRGVRR